MAETKMIDLNTVIGVYSLCNTGAVLVHAIDYAEDKILASINGENPEWCAMTEEYMEVTGETELALRSALSLSRCARSCVFTADNTDGGNDAEDC